MKKAVLAGLMIGLLLASCGESVPPLVLSAAANSAAVSLDCNVFFILPSSFHIRRDVTPSFLKAMQAADRKQAVSSEM